MKKKLLVLLYLFCQFFYLESSASANSINDKFGMWGSLTLTGNFQTFFPQNKKFHWLLMNQTRIQDETTKNIRLTENLLFAQIGYSLNEHASVWFGYTHDWIHPLHKASFQESRPYLDYVWKYPLTNVKFTSRTRFEARINQSTGDDGYRARQLLQIKYPLPNFSDVSVYVGDELLFYLNKNPFGKQGLAENRIFAGLSYKLNSSIETDLGYMGQYVDTTSGKNRFTHALQANISYHF